MTKQFCLVFETRFIYNLYPYIFTKVSPCGDVTRYHAASPVGLASDRHQSGVCEQHYNHTLLCTARV